MPERLTPNLRSRLIEWTRLYLRQSPYSTGDRPALRGERIGSPSTVGHLVRKGWFIEEGPAYGPRGGIKRRYRPGDEAIALVEGLDAKYGGARDVVDAYFHEHHSSSSDLATVEAFVPGTEYVPVMRSALFTAEGLRLAEQRGVTSFAVTVFSRRYDRRVTADFSIGELIRAHTNA